MTPSPARPAPERPAAGAPVPHFPKHHHAPSPPANGSAFAHVGLYLESTWATARMGLEEWQQLLLKMKALGMNALGVGLYGCWVVQSGLYGGERTEFLMVPFPEHPVLRTERTLRWLAPPPAGSDRTANDLRAALQTERFLPRMFAEDFFGQVVAFGQAQGINVRPHFNGPGHSTLLPEVFPDISAKDASGAPKGFGYCLTSPRTYELLFSLYRSVITRYLRPHGATWWHLGLDELDPYAGIDPADPTRVIDPWCECPTCTAHSQAHLLVDFALRTIEFLVANGIEHITLWHDALDKLHALPTFAARLRERGLAERVAVQWWRYQDPSLTVEPHGLRTWVTPMAGYWSNLFHHDYGANIQTMAAEGARVGAEGLDAYSIYDPTNYRNYAWLATVGRTPQADRHAFRAEQTRWLFQGQPVPLAFSHFERLFDSSYGPLGTLLDGLLAYHWTYPAHRQVRYPRDQIAQLAGDRLRIGPALAATEAQAQALADACHIAAPQAPDAERRQLLQEYACEAQKLAAVTAAFRQAASAWRHYRAAQVTITYAERLGSLTRAQAAFRNAQTPLLDAMREIEQTKAPFLVPYLLRDLTPLALWLAEAHDQIVDLKRQVEAGGTDSLPPL